MLNALRPTTRAVIDELDTVAALLAEGHLSDCTITRPHPLMVLVRRDRNMVLVTPGSVWDRGRDVLSPYLARFASGEAMLVLLGDISDPDLDRVMNKGLAALVGRKPTAQTLQVAIRNAFAMMESRGRAESRGKWLNRYRYELGELVEIARIMTTEREIDRLLDLILAKSRFITGADAGSIYVVEGEGPEMSRHVLRFKLTQNDSVQFDWSEFTIPISPQSIAGTTALENQPINIADVYDLPAGTPYAPDRSFDEKINYRTKSMLCAPLVNKAGECIGVLQLINKKREATRRLLGPEDFDELVVPFDERSQELLGALASQAGICLENAMLYEEIRRIFEGFVHASVEAIEQRDPTTSGHSRRVADLSLGIAHALESIDTGPYGAARLNQQDLKELEYAALLHDFGKIGVREQVLVKAKKLYPHDLEKLRARFDYARRSFETENLKRQIEALRRGADPATVEAIEQEFEKRREEIERAWQIIVNSNEPTVLSEGDFSQLDQLQRTLFRNAEDQLVPLLREEEGVNLQISRGSLNSSEIEEIRSHVTHTFRFLQKIPWGSTFSRIPQIAGAHHERLNGTGYPHRLHAEEIPLQSKIMSIADIFDALTASDRPYKKAVPIDRALTILTYEVKDNHIDPELFRIFQEARVWEQTSRG